MIGSRITRLAGETFAAFQARQRGDSAARTPPKKEGNRHRLNRLRRELETDSTPFGQGDNLGESPDF